MESKSGGEVGSVEPATGMCQDLGLTLNLGDFGVPFPGIDL